MGDLGDYGRYMPQTGDAERLDAALGARAPIGPPEPVRTPRNGDGVPIGR